MRADEQSECSRCQIHSGKQLLRCAHYENFCVQLVLDDYPVWPQPRRWLGKRATKPTYVLWRITEIVGPFAGAASGYGAFFDSEQDALAAFYTSERQMLEWRPS